MHARGSATRSSAAWQHVGPAGTRGSELGWQPATHRLAQSGGVARPWRGAWNTPCRKHHVTMTPQKSRAPGNKGQLRARLARGLARKARLLLVPRCAPVPLDRPSGNLGSWGTGRLKGCPGGSQGLGICKCEAGVGRATWAAGAFTVAFVRHHPLANYPPSAVIDGEIIVPAQPSTSG